MNKKLLLMAGAAVILILYIVVSKIDCSSDVPGLVSWEGQADEITIKRMDTMLILRMKEGKWLINDEGYPADMSKVNDIEKKMLEMKLIDLISEKGFYEKYDLVAEKSTVVTVKKGNETVRNIEFGKKSSTNRHTYVRVNGRPEVYLASGSYDRLFSKTVDELRDKEIFKVAKDAVDSFEINYLGRTFGFLKKMEEVKDDRKKAEKEGDKKEEGAPEKKPSPAEKWICRGYEYAALDKNRVTSLLSIFSPLRASAYPDIKKESLKRPVLSVKIKALGRDISVDIHNKDRDNNYTVVSSESPYVFTLPESRIKKIMIKDIEGLKEKK